MELPEQGLGKYGRRMAAKEESGKSGAPQPQDSPHRGLSTLPRAAGEWGIKTLGNHAECT